MRENIDGHKGDGACSKRMLTPAERSVWDDYLDMATSPLTPIPGQVCFGKDVGYTPEQLSIKLKTPVDVIRSANTAMTDLGMVTIENNGIIVINNWRRYQSDYQRQKGYRQRLQEEVTGKGDAVDIDKDKDNRYRYKRKEYKKIYTSVLAHWNEKKIIVHKYMNDYTKGRLNSKLDHGFTEDEIKATIDNYAYILKGRAYFWTKEWALGEFLQRGFDKFADLEAAKQRYADKYRDKDMFTKDVDDIKKAARDG